MHRHEIPPRSVPRADSRYLEVLTQTVFQAGFSWQVVRAKWPAFRRAFREFDVAAVARFGLRDIDRMMQDRDLVRNRRKLEAAVENARILAELQREHGSVRRWVRSLRLLSYAEKVAVLSRTFRFLGPTGVFFFLWCVGEDVPRWEERVPKGESRPPGPTRRRSAGAR